MASRATSWVWEHSRAKASALLVALRIAEQAGPTGENSWPGIQTIADSARISTRQAKRCLVQLEELGELLVYVNAGGSARCRADQRPNRYELPLVPDWTPPKSLTPRSDPTGILNNEVTPTSPREPSNEVTPTSPREPSNEVTPTSPREQSNEVTPTSPREADGVTYRVERGDIQGKNGVTPMSPDKELDLPRSTSSTQCARVQGLSEEMRDIAKDVNPRLSNDDIEVAWAKFKLHPKSRAPNISFQWGSWCATEYPSTERSGVTNHANRRPNRETRSQKLARQRAELKSSPTP